MKQLKKGMIIEIKKYSGFDKAIVLRVGKKRIDLYRINPLVDQEPVPPPALTIHTHKTPTIGARLLPQGWTVTETVGLGVANTKAISRVNANKDRFVFFVGHVDTNVFFVRRTKRIPRILGTLTKEEMLTHDKREIRLAAAGKYRPIKRNPFLVERKWEGQVPPCGEIKIGKLSKCTLI